MERLTKRSKNSDMVWFKDAENGNISLEPCELTAHHNRMMLDKLAAYEDAEEQGLLLRLPCKVGDTVWQMMFSGMNRKEKKPLYGIYEATVTEVSVDFYRNLLISTITNDTKKCKNKVTISAIGETIFLDREEAEAKLKEMEGSHDGE